MSKVRAVRRSDVKKPKSGAAPTAEVSANQVIRSLYGLFTDLGVDVNGTALGPANVVATISAAHTLYPYTSEIGEMLTFWHQSPEYLDQNGNPIRIKISGKGATFQRLAKLKAPKIDVAYLLSELERLGAVSIDEHKLITVHMRSFPVYEDKRLAAQHTLNVLEGFIKTLRHNLDSGPSNAEQLFHRIAQNDSFDGREIPALKVRVRRVGQSFLESFDDWLARKALSKTRKSKIKSKCCKVSIGVYLSVD